MRLRIVLVSFGALLSYLHVIALEVPAKIAKKRVDEIPPLTSALAVAKSPLEPVTMALSFSDSGVDSNPQPSDSSKPTIAVDEPEESKTTPQPEQTSSPANVTAAEVSTAPSSKSEPQTEAQEVKKSTTETAIVTDTEATIEAGVLEEEEQTETTPPAASSTPIPTTSIPDSTESATASESTETDATAQDTPATSPTSKIESVSTVEPAEPSSSPPPTGEVKVELIETTTTENPEPQPSLKDQQSSTPPSTTEAPSSTTEAPSSTTEAPPSTTETPSSTTEAPSSTTETPLTSEPSTTEAVITTTADLEPTTLSTFVSKLVTEASTSSGSTTAAPSIEVPTTSAPQLQEHTTTQTAKDLTEAPKNQDDEKADDEDSKDRSKCNHLPSYNPEETQKVFREETTFRNGTIKGKFTYINFDNRYRLVHYTRLPYGPVKIDLVEDLGKPNSSENQDGSSANSDDIPNAVLQLRNILPNSLYGFPFLSSKPSFERRSGDFMFDDKSFFYSTDSIATPNLHSPTVPVSVLPTQSAPRRYEFPIEDTLTKSLNDELQVGGSRSKSKTESDLESRHTVHGGHLFQYSPQQPIESAANLPQGIHQSVIQAPRFQYQYSPLASYPFQRSLQFAPTSHYSAEASQGSLGVDSSNLPMSQAHQPHSHEHFIAPFMLTHASQSDISQDSAPKLKLRVKTSRVLDDWNGARSAQLRDTPIDPKSDSHSNYNFRQQRQRSGKQNHDLKPAVNPLPVVYHVLSESARDRGFALTNQNQQFAMAYDHDH